MHGKLKLLTNQGLYIIMHRLHRRLEYRTGSTSFPLGGKGQPERAAFLSRDFTAPNGGLKRLEKD